MNWQALVDPSVSGRLCVTLLHSIWQVALLALVAWGLDRLWRRRSVDRSYAVHVAALIAALVAMPATFGLVEVDRAPLAAQTERLVERGTTTLPLAATTLPENPAEVGKLASPTGDGLPAAFGTVPPAVAAAGAEDAFPSWLDVAPWIAAFYAIGVLVMLVRVGVSSWRAQRLGATAQPIGDRALIDRLNSLAQKWSMGVVPVLARAEQIVVPKLVGLMRPTILLPASAITGLSADEMEMILAHELAHLRRYDMWVNLLQRLAEAVLFFNPALWYLSRRISAIREYCCDELTCRALSASGGEPRARYASALLRVVELGAASVSARGSSPTPAGSDLAALAANGRSPSELRRRVAHLFGEPLREPLRISRGGLLTLVTVAGLLLIGPALWHSAADSAHGSGEASDDNSTETRQFDLQIVGPGGKPVPRATVEIATSPVPAREQILRGEFVRNTSYRVFAKTDGAGRLIVKVPTKPGQFTVRIEHPGYGPYRTEWNSSNHPRSIPSKFTAELESAWSAGGVVVDKGGRPIDGATIVVRTEYKRRPGEIGEARFRARLTTNADGGWSFHSVPDSMREVFVEIDHPEYKPNRRSLTEGEFGFEPGQEPTAKITLVQGLVVTGTVTDESGAPIAGALVRTEFLNELRRAETDQNGMYRLVGCEPTMARITVSAENKALDLKKVRIAPDMAPVDFVMKPGGHVRVRVVDEQGDGIPKARIFFQRWRGRIDQYEFDHVNEYADENGVWEWNEAPLDEIQADICRPGGMELSRQSLIAREEEYVFRPPRALVVTGKVVDAVTKAPIERFRVVPGLRNSDPEIRMNWIPNDSYEASDGQYRVRLKHDYPAHLLRIEAATYKIAISRDIATDEGEVTIDFELEPAVDVAATVITPKGEPAAGAKIALGVAGAQINVENGAIDDTSTYATRLDTDEAGSFSIPARDEPFQIVITHPSGFAYLKSQEGPIPTNIRLTAWTRVEGTFRVGPRPVPNVAITLNSEPIHSYGRDVPSISTHHYMTTDTEGRFVFDRVFPGTGRIGRRILLMVSDGATEVTSSQMVTVNLPAGETTQIDLGGTGRPVIGRLAPSEDHEEKVLWNFALVNVKADLVRPPAPQPPADVRDDRERRKAWWEAWKATDAGIAWQAANAAYETLRSESPYITASVDRDGSFRIDDVPPGDYVLSVRFSQHPGGSLRNYRFSVPEIDGERLDRPLDLGVLALE